MFEHIPEGEKKLAWFRLLKPLITNRSKLPNPEVSPLLIVLNKNEGIRTWCDIKMSIEMALKYCVNAECIFARSAKLKKDPNPDYVIDEMFAELRSVSYLVEKGVANIIYHKENSVDFTATFAGKTFGIETRYIHGPSFKTQTKVISRKDENTQLPVYCLHAERLAPDMPVGLMERLDFFYQEKEEQVLKHGYDSSNAIIVLVSELEELYAPWLCHEIIEGKHCIEHFVLNCSIPTVIIAPGSIYEPNDEALNGVFGKLNKMEYVNFQQIWSSTTSC